MIIPVNFQWDHSIGQQIHFINKFLKKFPAGKEITIDFSGFQFSPPFLSVFFASFIESNPQVKWNNHHSTSYLKFIAFPTGFKPDQVQDWENVLSSYKNKTYLPLVHFNTSKAGTDSSERNNVISHLCQVVKNITNIPVNYYTAISYFISELSDNIVDHSGTTRGWLSFQYYANYDVIDFCISDSGMGFLGAYNSYKGENDYSHINTHTDALDSVIKGFSTKHIHERGFGVHTSREMLIKGLKGHFLLLSGDALLYNYDLVDFRATFNGTLAFMRIPCKSFDRNFSYTNFVE